MFRNPNTKWNQYQFIIFGAMSTTMQTDCNTPKCVRAENE